ncbi:hypothetical protein [Synoicihabitans lomoniglobus]|uniref:Uncharacterized protein n=1 Tax=Synoicihabitans lomoniglobus TaxID=2909285 RepID=A0AAF0I4U0_9BACT|nr:hypothetical protein [Opitutaceae bacterium LMO-M01]WED67004.1 hypothetical protein PXH66_09090 [Opitutaceae bacterium LMO-M01]
MSRPLIAALIVSLTLPWVAVVFVLLRFTPAPPPSVESTAITPSPSVTDALKPEFVATGRWGQLEMNRIIIEPPDDLITVNAQPVTHIDWHFPGYSDLALQDLWTRAKLSPDQANFLTNPDNWSRQSTGISIGVPKTIIMGLSHESRQIVYAALSRHDTNRGQWAPASFRAESAADWFADSELTEDTINIVQPLLYRRGDCLLFSDYSLILADLKTQRQRLQLTRALARSTSQLVKLRIMPDTNMENLVEYWSLGQKRREIEPLLKSLPRPPGGFTLDLIHLLPPVARRLLYTYASPPARDEATFRDCHWTSLNFANAEIDDRYRDIEEVVNAYQQDYRPVTDAPRLGDIYLFVTRGDVVLHSCVHIAGDLVFTKNGSWAAAPFILMRLPDVISLYPTDEEIEIQHLRRRE